MLQTKYQKVYKVHPYGIKLSNSALCSTGLREIDLAKIVFDSSSLI